MSACNCEQERVTRFDPTVQIDLFTQKAQAKVDILWVVDNSESMFEEQSKVAGGFQSFFTSLVESQVDYHIGVISTDPKDQGKLRKYTADAVEGCDQCRFLSSKVRCKDAKVNIEGLLPTQIVAKLKSECQAALVFRNLIQVGTDGSAFEEGFRQASLALGAGVLDPATGKPTGEIPEENMGFFREDASLFVIFVSDEDEGAKADGSPILYYSRLFENLKTAGNEAKVSISAIIGWPKDGQTPSLEKVCPILKSGYDGRLDTDDPQLALVKEVLLKRTGCEDRPNPGADAVTVAEAGGRYVELACRTGGVLSNLCDSDYSTSLDLLGANAAGLKRKYVLSKISEIEMGRDCELFTADDDVLDCNDDGDKDDENIDLALCVTGIPLGGDGTEVLVPRSEVVGWTLEQNSGALNFRGQFLPAPGTSLTVRYKLKSKISANCDFES